MKIGEMENEKLLKPSGDWFKTRNDGRHREEMDVVESTLGMNLCLLYSVDIQLSVKMFFKPHFQ